MENERGEGPFIDNNNFYPLDYHPHQDKEFPSPYGDLGRWIHDNEKCGCSSPRQLVYWFPRPVREQLYSYGYAPVVLEVPDEYVDVGRYQVLYNQDAATYVHKKENMNDA